MKAARIIIVVISTCIIIAAISYGFLYLMSSKPNERFYVNYDAAMRGDAAKGYWVPDFLPKSATDIYMRYGVDPSFLQIEFSYDSKDEQNIIASFVRVVSPIDLKIALRAMNRERWSQQDTDGETIVYIPKPTQGESLEPEIYLAIDPVKGVAWYTLE